MTTIKGIIRRAFLGGKRLRPWHGRALQYAHSAAYLIQRQRLLQDLSVDLVLDVGANVGQFASALRNVWSGEILSFEPTSGAYAQLAEKATASVNWRAFNLAIGKAEGTLRLGVSENSVFSSSKSLTAFATRRFGREASVKSFETVRLRRMDEFLEETVPDWRARSIFLKMDTQGFDHEVFEGASGCLERIVALQSEISVVPIYSDVPTWIESLDEFSAKGFVASGMYPVSIDGVRAVEFDCLMSRGQST